MNTGSIPVKILLLLIMLAFLAGAFFQGRLILDVLWQGVLPDGDHGHWSLHHLILLQSMLMVLPFRKDENPKSWMGIAIVGLGMLTAELFFSGQNPAGVALFVCGLSLLLSTIGIYHFARKQKRCYPLVAFYGLLTPFPVYFIGQYLTGSLTPEGLARFQFVFSHLGTISFQALIAMACAGALLPGQATE